MKKSIKALSFLCLIALLLQSKSFAATFGSDSQNPYATKGCAYANIAADNYVNNLYNILTSIDPYPYAPITTSSQATRYQDDQAWASDIEGGFANSKNIFVYAGHGFPYTTFLNQGVNGGASAHFYTSNSTTLHSSEVAGNANAQWDYIRLGSDSNRWALFQTCRFLVDGGDNNNTNRIKSMFQGTHMIMGFASRMYMHSYEGTTMGKNLRQGNTWKAAFFNAAEQYQPYLSATCNQNSNPTYNGKTVARIYGWTTNVNNDTAYSSTSAAPTWSTTNDYQFTTVDDLIVDMGYDSSASCN